MDRTLKEIIAVFLSIFILFVAWYGSYSPMRKAQTYIATLQSMQTNPVSSLLDLQTRLSIPLDSSSPIGQEEIVRNMADSVLSFIQRSNDATTTAKLVDYVTSYFNPILARGKGMSFGQDVYLMGVMNEMAYTRTGDKVYLVASQKYYEQGVALGPNRPQVLYGLFDVYRMKGDVPNALSIGSRILANWPGDQNVQRGISQLLSQQASSSVPKGNPPTIKKVN